METLAKYLDFFGVILNAILVSFTLEALKRMFPKIKTRPFLPLVSLAYTLLYIPFFEYRWDNFQVLFIHYIFTISFSVLYYLYLGEKTIIRLLDMASGAVDSTAKQVESKPVDRGNE